LKKLWMLPGAGRFVSLAGDARLWPVAAGCFPAAAAAAAAASSLPPGASSLAAGDGAAFAPKNAATERCCLDASVTRAHASSSWYEAYSQQQP